MAKIGLAYPAWAPMVSEPTGSIPTYSAGFTLGKAIRADLAIAYAEGQLYADNQLAEDAVEFASGTIELETDNMSIANTGTIYGATVVGDELTSDSGDTAPYGGFGYYQVLMVSGVKKYRAYFYPKVKARMGNDTAATKAGSFVLGVTPITLTVMEPLYGPWRYVKEFTTEAAALAYVDTKLSVAVWHQMNVQQQGNTVAKYCTPLGYIMVANAGTFEISVTGVVSALYDNGVDSKASIAAGKYTLSNVVAAHTIAVIF